MLNRSSHAFPCKPVSIAECFAFCSETGEFKFYLGNVGLPIRETRIGALSSACGRRARFANAQALLAISAMPNPDSGRMAPIPIPPAGNRVPCPLSFHPLCGWRNLYFSVKTRKNANLPVFSFVYRAAINETGGAGTSGSCRGVGQRPTVTPRLLTR